MYDFMGWEEEEEQPTGISPQAQTDQPINLPRDMRSSKKPEQKESVNLKNLLKESLKGKKPKKEDLGDHKDITGKFLKEFELEEPDFDYIKEDEIKDIFKTMVMAPEEKQGLMLQAVSRIDLSKLFNWFDTTYGTNFSKNYKPPKPISEITARLDKQRLQGIEESKIKFNLLKEAKREKNKYELAKYKTRAMIAKARQSLLEKRKGINTKIANFEQKIKTSIFQLHSMMGDVAKSFNTEYTGPVGYLRTLAGKATGGMFEKEATRLANKLKSMIAIIAPPLIGAAQTKIELENLKALLPSSFDNKEIYVEKMLDSMRYVNNMFKGLYGKKGNEFGTVIDLELPFPNAEIIRWKHIIGEEELPTLGE